MDKLLINKIIGKKYSVDLDDAVYNLRDVSEELRNTIVLSLDIDEEFVLRNKRRLKAIYNNISPIEELLSDEELLKGYINSKKYLKKYVNSIQGNISGILDSLDILDNKALTYHSNMLIDLLLVY